MFEKPQARRRQRYQLSPVIGGKAELWQPRADLRAFGNQAFPSPEQLRVALDLRIGAPPRS